MPDRRTRIEPLERRIALSAGALDMGFGGGLVTLPGTYANVTVPPTHPLAVQPDGKVLVAGRFFTIARYNADGSLDPSFAQGGVFHTTVGTVDDGAAGFDEFNAIAVAPDGSIFVAGTGTHQFNAQAVLLKLSPTGQLLMLRHDDFAAAVATEPFFADILGLAIQSNGDVVGVGTASNNFLLVRYRPDGRWTPHSALVARCCQA